VFLLTETWHTASTGTASTCCALARYSIIDKPQPVTSTSVANHEGVAAVISDYVTYRLIPAPSEAQSFDLMCFSVTSSDVTIVILLLYRPGSSCLTNNFYSELVEYLESLALCKCQIIVIGDFNIRTEKSATMTQSKWMTYIQISAGQARIKTTPALPTERKCLLVSRNYIASCTISKHTRDRPVRKIA